MNHETCRRRSIRLKGYDYAQAGAYFITVCTQGRECLFGECANGKFNFNEAGRMVEAVWNELPIRFPDIETDTFVVMPNHIHGIIMIHSETRRGDPCDRPGMGHRRGEYKIRPYDGPEKCGGNKNGTLSGSLGRIIQAFKSITTVSYVEGVSRHGWPPFPGRLWQRNYYEHVIRNDDDLNRIREYIQNNPARWSEDEENPERVNPTT
ncbi:MAG: transposase [Dehalococcoidia bacterium]